MVGLDWYPCCRLKCVGDSVWLGWSGIHVAGFNLQHGYHSKPTTLNLQHTSNQEKYDQYDNSTE